MVTKMSIKGKSLELSAETFRPVEVRSVCDHDRYQLQRATRGEQEDNKRGNKRVKVGYRLPSAQ